MPQTGPKQISKERLLSALRKHAGVYSLAAKELGCDRTNVSQRVKRSPELAKAAEEVRQEIGDAVEAGIIKKILAGDGPMLRWYAELKLKDRGYVRRIEATGANGAPLAPSDVRVTIRYVDGDADAEPDDDAIPV